MRHIILKSVLPSLVLGAIGCSDIQSAELPQIATDQVSSKMGEGFRVVNAEHLVQFEIIRTALSTLSINFEKKIKDCDNELKLIGENGTDVSHIRNLSKASLEEYKAEEQLILNSLHKLSQAHTDVSHAFFEIQSANLESKKTEEKKNSVEFLTWLRSLMTSTELK